MTGSRSIPHSVDGPPPKVMKLWWHTSQELISHLGHCWATPGGAAPRGVKAPVLRNDSHWSQVDLKTHVFRLIRLLRLFRVIVIRLVMVKVFSVVGIQKDGMTEMKNSVIFCFSVPDSFVGHVKTSN